MVNSYDDFEDCLKKFRCNYGSQNPKERLNDLNVDFDEYASKYQINKKILDEYNIKYSMHPEPVNGRN